MSSPFDIDSTLAALADPHRRRIVELLRDKPRRAGELADEVGLNPSALSRHLRILKSSHMITESHPDFDARVRIYRLSSGPMDGLKVWLDETERTWAEQLQSFKERVEGGS